MCDVAWLNCLQCTDRWHDLLQLRQRTLSRASRPWSERGRRSAQVRGVFFSGRFDDSYRGPAARLPPST